jgi:ferredoxin--NADP+ reductase
MVDGTGMCGACRAEVDGQTRFACVDGPEFDGYQVDWDLLLARQRIYLEEEQKAMEAWQRSSSTHNSQSQAEYQQQEKV